MTKTPTLRDFVKSYVQNQEYKTSDEDYRRWLKENGIDSERIYADSIRDITSDYKMAKSEYGALAESLSNLGLTASGYSDYLNGKAYSEMQKRKEGARSKYAENEEKNRKGYSEYVAELAKAEKSSYDNVVSSITAAGIMDYDEAYSFALSQGLSESSAELAAKSASDNVRRKTRESALKTIIGQSFGKSQAREYSLALGLSKTEAEELAEYADKINRQPYYSSDYLEYLKNKWAENGGN